MSGPSQPSIVGVPPPGDFRFHLGLRPGSLREFFRPTVEREEILAERRQWLASDPGRYACASADAEVLLDDFRHALVEWGFIDPRTGARVGELGAAVEPDFMILAPDDENVLRMRAGAVCFPSSWSLEEKSGRAVDFIHSGVPGLNEQLGAQIERFLSRLKPDAAFVRENWGLAATAERNMHPALARPMLAGDVDPRGAWLRIEHQVFSALPHGRGVAFGIRIKNHPLGDVLADPFARARLHDALVTMDPQVAAYKSLNAALPALIRLCG